MSSAARNMRRREGNLGARNKRGPGSYRKMALTRRARGSYAGMKRGSRGRFSSA